MTALRATDVHPLLTTAAGDGPSGQAAQPMLGATGDGRNRAPRDVLKRSNEQGPHIGRAVV